MSTFLFEMDPKTQTVQLKGVHHKYLAQVSPLAAAVPSPQQVSGQDETPREGDEQGDPALDSGPGTETGLAATHQT